MILQPTTTAVALAGRAAHRADAVYCLTAGLALVGQAVPGLYSHWSAATTRLILGQLAQPLANCFGCNACLQTYLLYCHLLVLAIAVIHAQPTAGVIERVSDAHASDPTTDCQVSTARVSTVAVAL